MMTIKRIIFKRSDTVNDEGKITMNDFLDVITRKKQERSKFATVNKEDVYSDE